MKKMRNNNEIRLTMERRFKGKRTVYEVPKFSDLTLWCVATDSYKICERTLITYPTKT